MKTHLTACIIVGLALAWNPNSQAQSPLVVTPKTLLPLNEPGLPGFSAPLPRPAANLLAANNNNAAGFPTDASGALKGLPELPVEGYWIEDAPLNDVFQYLARSAGLQYFHNHSLKGPDYNVTGHLLLKDPRKQLDDLARAYSLSVVVEGSTLFIYTSDQNNKVPLEQMVYQLKYLRKTGFGRSPMKEAISGQSGSSGGGTGGAGGGSQGGAGGSSESMAAGSGHGAGPQDPFEQELRDIINPLLSPRGTMVYQRKTNSVIILDTAEVLKRATSLLEEVDKPKRQIAINVRVLTIKNQLTSKVGVDWTSVLGDGTSIQVTKNLNSLFNLPDTYSRTTQMVQNVAGTFVTQKFTGSLAGTSGGSGSTGSGSTGSSGGSSTTPTVGTSAVTTSTPSSASNLSKGFTNSLTFTPTQMTAIVHALHAGNIARDDTGPTLITEDNEPAIISVIDRYPIITQQLNGVGNNASQVSESVRYKVDPDDPNPSANPDMTREIGVTLSVTPTLLPDGTLRLNLRPRVASIVDVITSKQGNQFPRVSESTVEAISRVPNGHSLLLGGFYDFNDSHADSQVPILGQIPLLKKLFSYKDREKSQISLIFIVTPYAYDASSVEELTTINKKTPTSLPKNWNDPNKGFPGPPVKNPGFWNSLKGAFKGNRPAENGNGKDNPLLPPPPANGEDDAPPLPTYQPPKAQLGRN